MSLPAMRLNRVVRHSHRWGITLSMMVAVLVTAAIGGEARAPMPAAGASPYEPINYRVTAGDQAVDVHTLWPNAPGNRYTLLTVHYASLCLSRTDEFLVEVDSPIKSVVLAPESAPLLHHIAGNRLLVSSHGPAKAMLRINDGEPLFLFISLPKERPAVDQPGVISLPEDGVDRTGRVAATSALQSAIDEAGRKGPGATVHVGPGTYLTGSLWMRSGVTLYLDEGARLLADPASGAFPRRAYDRMPGWHPRTDPDPHTAMIWFEGVRDAALRGPGTIDGQGHTRRMRNFAQGRLHINQLRVIDSENIHVEGPVLRDSEFWSVHLLRSRNVTIRDLKVINEMLLRGWNADQPDSTWNNTDGINPDSCQNVLVEDVFLHTGDNCLVVKTSNSGPSPAPDAENIVFRRAVVAASSGALKIGTETTAEGIRNVLWEDINVLPIHRARAITLVPRDVSVLENIVFRRIRVESDTPWVHAEITARVPGQARLSRMRNIVFEDFELPVDSVGMVGAPDPAGMELTFRRIFRGGVPVKTVAELKLAGADLLGGIVLQHH